MTDSVPLYRYYAGHPKSDHFYTTDASEIGTTTKAQTGNDGYVYEGVECYVYPFIPDSNSNNDSDKSNGHSKDYFLGIGLGFGVLSSLFVFSGLVLFVKNWREYSKVFILVFIYNICYKCVF